MTISIGLKVVLFICLFIAFACLFIYLRKNSILKKAFNEVYMNLDSASMRRARNRKRELHQLYSEKNILERILERAEDKLRYSGLTKLFSFLSIEVWIVLLLVFGSTVHLLLWFFTKNYSMSIWVGIAFVGVIVFVENYLALKNYKAVDDELMEFLNMLGNYSVTAGDITGVFEAVSKYMHEPLKSALEECYYEAQMTGDTSTALAAMADKIEHPRFKEIIKNVEICSRYSADFTMIVTNSRKIIQDYKRSKQERQAMVKEAIVNMIILAIMLLVVLFAVDMLIEVSIWHILFMTLIGRICMAILIAICVAFYFKVASIDKE